MKVVFPICCGVDVHKTFVVATIITTLADSLQPHYQKKRFSTFNSDLFRIGLVKSNFIPGLNIRILREFTHYRYKLVSMTSRDYLWLSSD